MTGRIPLIARDLKRLYTGFLIAALVLFVVCSILTEFNPAVLVANGDAFWEFITQDFLPPALPKASRIPGVLDSVLVTLRFEAQGRSLDMELPAFLALTELERRLLETLGEMDPVRFGSAPGVALNQEGRVLDGAVTLAQAGVWDGSVLDAVLEPGGARG